MLAPIVRAEQAYGEAMDATMYSIGPFDDDDEPEFPELDGPVYLLGGCALVDAIWAAVGDWTRSATFSACCGPCWTGGSRPGQRGPADALLGTFATHYRFEQPADHDELERIGNLAAMRW